MFVTCVPRMSTAAIPKGGFAALVAMRAVDFPPPSGVAQCISPDAFVGAALVAV